MRAVIIDPSKTPAIYEQEIAPDLESMQELLGGMLEMHRIAPKDYLFVDEEWTLKKKPKHVGAFKIGPSIFGGRGIITGSSGKSATLSLLDVSGRVTILKRK